MHQIITGTTQQQNTHLGRELGLQLLKTILGACLRLNVPKLIQNLG